MRLVSIEMIKPGMRLAQPIYRYDNGNILLRADVELKPFYIHRLKELQYSHVYIRDLNDPEENMIIEPIKLETRVKAGIAFRETVNVIEKTKSVNIFKLQKVVGEMVDQITKNNDVIYNMLDIRSYDNYTFAHSVNVCTISLIIGSWMRLSRSDLEFLGIGALLHDIGKIFVDAGILNKPSHLEPEEYELIKKHARDGYDILKDKICINYISSHIAFQHHERQDGSGYPRGLTGDKIHRFAKIVAVADVYDAMTSSRVYRQALPSHFVLDQIKSDADKKFDRAVVESLQKMIAPYPVGSLLLLTNGDTVIVHKVTRLEFKVKVDSGPREGHLYNLYHLPDVSVAKRIS